MIKLVNGIPVEMSAEEEAAWIASLPVVNPVPQRITALQGLLAIDQAGLSIDYQTWATSSDRTFAERAFIDKAQTWNRDDSVVAAGATALGLTSEQVDELFIAASAL
jgi:hypothetical protein